MPKGKTPERFQEEFIYPFVVSGEFEIDNEGRIWRRRRRGRSCERVRAEHQPEENGYLVVRRMVNGRRYYCGAHRLVWRHFNGPIPALHTINHKNGVKDCNRPDNLEPKTYGGNTAHAYATGLMDEHGESNPAAKLTDNEVTQIRLAYSSGGFTQQQLAEKYGVRHQQISRIVRGQRRPKQGGPILNRDLRHIASGRSQATGRFTQKDGVAA